MEPVERRGFFHVAPGSWVWVYWLSSSEHSSFDGEFPTDVKFVAMGDKEVAPAFDLHCKIAQQAQKQGKKILWNTRGLWTSSMLGVIPSLVHGIRVILDDQTKERWGKILYQAAWLKKRGVWVEVALLPGKEDAERLRHRFIKSFMDSVSSDTPLHLVRTFSPRISAQTLISLADWFSEFLPHVYVDLLPGNPREITLCPHCEAPLVYRFGWMVLENRIWQGRCPECLTPQPGLWIP